MQTVYTIALGDLWQSSLNGLVTILANPSWPTVLSIMGVLATLTGVAAYLKERNPMTFMTHGVLFMLVNVVLLAPTQSVQIKDITRPEGVYQVDHVPSSLVTIASLTTSIGFLVTQIFEESLARPDSVTYTKTGMMFGSVLFKKSRQAKALDTQLQEFLPKYFESCVEPDINISHKYSMSDIVNSNDLYTLILTNPSKIFGFFALNLDETLADGEKNTVKYYSCNDAATVIKNRVGIDTNTNGKTWKWYVNSIFNNRPNGSSLLSSNMQASYDYFYAAGQTTQKILRQNVFMNSIRDGMHSFSSSSDNASDTLNLINETSKLKTRLSWRSAGDLAVWFLPVIQSVFMVILVLCFPLVLAIATISHKTFGFTTLLNYAKAFIYLQTWPLMFAIVNFCGSFYIKSSNGQGALTLAESDYQTILHSDVQSVMGYLCMMVPFLAYFVTKGATAMMSHGISGLTSGMSSTASQQASIGADNNWSFNNMSHDNVNANKYDTNMLHRSGMSTNQLANGTLESVMADGSHVFDTSSSISKLGANIDWKSSLHSGLTNQARESSQRAKTYLAGANHSAQNAISQLNQLSNSRGSSSNLLEGYDNSEVSNIQRGASMRASAIKSYMAKTGASEAEAVSYLSGHSTNASASASLGAKFMGTGAETSLSGSDTDSHEARRTTSTSKETSESDTAQLQKEYNEGTNIMNDVRRNHSGNSQKTEADNYLDQIQSNISESNSNYQQYQDSETRSHELSDAASKTSSMDSTQTHNMNQQFVQYVESKYGESEARTLLSENANSDIIDKRDEIISDFVDQKINGKINNNFESNKSGLGADLDSVENKVPVKVTQSSKVVPNGENIPQKGEVKKNEKEQKDVADGRILSAKQHVGEHPREISEKTDELSKDQKKNKQLKDDEYNSEMKKQTVKSATGEAVKEGAYELVKGATNNEDLY